MSDGRRIVLLGPQRFHPTVRDVLAELPEHRPGRPVAVITAGWEEREDEYRPFQDHIDGPVVNLSIFARCEDVYRHDPDLRGGVRARESQVGEAHVELHSPIGLSRKGSSHELFMKEAEARVFTEP